jgi:hypothetical protein
MSMRDPPASVGMSHWTKANLCGVLRLGAHPGVCKTFGRVLRNYKQHSKDTKIHKYIVLPFRMVLVLK